jgi:hypothetical protein
LSADTDAISLKQPNRSAPPCDTAKQVTPHQVNASNTTKPYRNLESDIQFILQHYAPIVVSTLGETVLSRNQICGGWVDILPLVVTTRRSDQPLVSAIKTLATALRHHDIREDVFQPRILEMYCESLRHMSKALAEAQGVFQVEHCAAIMCLAVTDVRPQPIVCLLSRQIN